MFELTERQRQLINAVIEMFMQTATPVGSEELKDTYSFDFSAATIRNELADLAKEGLLFKEHSSAGRVPTTLAWRYYITEVLNETPQDVLSEIEHRNRIIQNRFSIDRIVKEATSSLAEYTNYASLGIVRNTNRQNQYTPIYLSGLANLIDLPEFHDIEKFKTLIQLLEDSHSLNKIFDMSKVNNDISILIGEEMGLTELSHVALVFSKFHIGKNDNVILSVIGPSRLNYSKVIPAVRMMMKNVQEATMGW
ncbi:hypothetical protein IPJ91_01755 [bacterium]|nr:MAG: hypothetical protein IPJ91_01755 [bacterium]